MPCLLARGGEADRGLLVNVCAGNGPSAESTRPCFLQLWHITSSTCACPKGPASRCLFMTHASQVQRGASRGPAHALPAACTHGQELMLAACAYGQEHALFLQAHLMWSKAVVPRRMAAGCLGGRAKGPLVRSAAVDNQLCPPVPPLQLAQSHVFSNDAPGQALRWLAERSSCHGRDFCRLQACF